MSASGPVPGKKAKPTTIPPSVAPKKRLVESTTNGEGGKKKKTQKTIEAGGTVAQSEKFSVPAPVPAKRKVAAKPQSKSKRIELHEEEEEAEDEEDDEAAQSEEQEDNEEGPEQEEEEQKQQELDNAEEIKEDLMLEMQIRNCGLALLQYVHKSLGPVLAHAKQTVQSVRDEEMKLLQALKAVRVSDTEGSIVGSQLELTRHEHEQQKGELATVKARADIVETQLASFPSMIQSHKEQLSELGVRDAPKPSVEILQDCWVYFNARQRMPETIAELEELMKDRRKRPAVLPLAPSVVKQLLIAQLRRS